MKLLVIDDEAEFRKVICRALRHRGFEVFEAPDGLTGVRLARAHLPDLVLSDVNMDQVDGYTALSVLRQHPSTANIPLILMTGQANLDGMRKGMALGADDYLSKPFTMEELMNAVDLRLAQRKALREEADRKLDSLRSSISLMLPHELITPLNGIIGLSELIGSDPGSYSLQELAEFGKTISESAARLERLIKNFLIYAQIEMLAANPALARALRDTQIPDTAAAIGRAARTRAEAARRVNDLQLELAPAPAAISEPHLTKLVEEIVDNAFRYSAAGTPVKVTTTATGNELWISITDRGRGMKPEFLNSIGAYMQFERKVYEQQGTGLGLAIAKRLSELHGGRLTIKSEPNAGTTVQIALLTAASPATPAGE